MSETTSQDESTKVEPDQKAQDANQGAAADTEAETNWQAEAEKWKELARKHEDRAKSNTEKAQAYEEYLESQKTEDQKRADKLQALESERDSALAQLRRYQAGLKYGLTDEDLALLGDGEDFDQRAKALAERIRTEPKRRNLAQNSENKTGGRADDWLRLHL